MTTLIIGGESQGKLNIALKMTGFSMNQVADGGKMLFSELEQAQVIDRLHLLTRKLLRENGTLDGLLEQLYGKTVICNEIGCGIVPMDPFERRWREDTGRLCCSLAQTADTVIRVHCGIAQYIKGVKK